MSFEFLYGIKNVILWYLKCPRRHKYEAIGVGVQIHNFLRRQIFAKGALNVRACNWQQQQEFNKNKIFKARWDLASYPFYYLIYLDRYFSGSVQLVSYNYILPWITLYTYVSELYLLNLFSHILVSLRSLGQPILGKFFLGEYSGEYYSDWK